MRESIAVPDQFFAFEFTVGNRSMQTINGQSHGVLTWRAPEGQLDFRLFDAVWQTLRRGDQWNARITAAESQMAQDNAQTQARISQIQSQMSRDTMNEIAKRGQIMAQTRPRFGIRIAGTPRAASHRTRCISIESGHRE